MIWRRWWARNRATSFAKELKGQALLQEKGGKVLSQTAANESAAMLPQDIGLKEGKTTKRSPVPKANIASEGRAYTPPRRRPQGQPGVTPDKAGKGEPPAQEGHQAARGTRQGPKIVFELEKVWR